MNETMKVDIRSSRKWERENDKRTKKSLYFLILMYKITTIYLWLKSYLSFFIGLDNLDFLTLIRFFQCRLQNKLGLQDILDFFCNLCGHSMVRTCNMVEAAQKQNRIIFGSIYVKLHPLVKLCTGIVWVPRVWTSNYMCGSIGIVHICKSNSCSQYRFFPYWKRSQHRSCRQYPSLAKCHLGTF